MKKEYKMREIKIRNYIQEETEQRNNVKKGLGDEGRIQDGENKEGGRNI